MRVRDVMERGVEVVSPEATLQAATDMMRRLDVGLLPVCDGDRLVGLLTDRDITVRATAAGGDPTTARVQQVMTPDVVFCLADDDLRVAVQLMEEYQVDRLPVLDDERRLLGMVSQGYVLDHGRDEPAGTRV